MTLQMTYFRAELVQLIVSQSDSQLKLTCRDMAWRKILSVFDWWSYHAGRWTM